MEYLALSSDAPGTDPVVLIDGPPYDPWVVIGDIDVGAAQWDTTYGSPYGTRGAAVAADRVGNRQVVMTLRGDFSSKAEAAAYENELAAVLDEMRRFGGWLTYRVHGGTRRTHWRVLARAYEMSPWGQRFDRVNELRPRLTLTVEPFPYGDPMDWHDNFDDASTLSAEYTTAPTITTGLTTDLATGSGYLAPTSGALGDAFYLVHTGNGYDLGDAEARALIKTGDASTSWKAGLVLKYIDKDNYLIGFVEYAGGAWRIRVYSRLAGSLTLLDNTSLTSAPVAGAPYWIQFRQNGHRLTLEWGTGLLPLTPIDSFSVSLTGAAAETLGAGAVGKAGLYLLPQHTGDRVERFMVDPYTYRDVDRYPIEVRGNVPGTAPAVLDVDLNGTGGPWLMLAWGPRAEAWNRVHNGGIEVAATGLAGGGTVGWSVASGSPLTGVATSVNRVTTAAARGVASGEIVTPANANRGAWYRVSAPFKTDRTYVFRVKVRANSGVTTNVRARFGGGADNASSTAVALSTTWTEHVVEWTPSTDMYSADIAIETTAATATTFQFDDAKVYPKDDGEPVTSGVGLEGSPAWGYLDGLAGFTSSGMATSASLSGESYAQLAASVSGAGASYALAWAVDPTLIPQDDHAGPTRDVEVWARLAMSSAFTGGVTAVLSIAGSIYTYEWGTDGVSLVMPNATSAFRIYRLGTIPMPDLIGDTGSTLLQLGFDVAAGTNGQPIGVDCLWLVNPRARALTPTAIDPDSGYPALAPDGRVNPEGMVTGIRNGSHQHIGTLSGGIELPTGAVDFLVLHSNAVPDAPTTGGVGAFTLTGTETYTPCDVHLRVRPRFEYLIAEE